MQIPLFASKNTHGETFTAILVRWDSKENFPPGHGIATEFLRIRAYPSSEDAALKNLTPHDHYRFTYKNFFQVEVPCV